MGRIDATVARLRNTPHLGRDLLAIVMVLVLGIAATVFLLVQTRATVPLLSRDYTFSADFEKAPGLQLGARQEVRIAGVAVGKIRDASISPEGTARLSFTIDPGHEIYRNARLVMRSKSPVNLMYVTLDPGTPAAGRLPTDGVIPSSRTERITQSFELLDNLDDRARAALTDLVDEADVALAAAPADLPAGLHDTSDAVKSLQPVVEALEQRRANLRHLVSSLSTIATVAGKDSERLLQLVAALETTLSVVSQRDAELGKAIDQLPAVTSMLRTSMESAARLSKELSPTLESLTKASNDLPKTVDDLTKTVRTARKVVKKADPVVTKAVPVVRDLRPLTSDLRSALDDLSPVTSNLPGVTAKLVPWLNDLGAFVYNTSSSFSLGDANGGIGRADLVVKLLKPTGGEL